MVYVKQTIVPWSQGCELELLHQLVYCASLVERNYVDCNTHFEYFGSEEDLERFRAVLRQASERWP